MTTTLEGHWIVIGKTRDESIFMVRHLGIVTIGYAAQLVRLTDGYAGQIRRLNKIAAAIGEAHISIEIAMREATVSLSAFNEALRDL